MEEFVWFLFGFIVAGAFKYLAGITNFIILSGYNPTIIAIFILALALTHINYKK